MSPFFTFIIIGLVHVSCLQGTSSLVIKCGLFSWNKLSTARHAPAIVSPNPHIGSSQRSLPLFRLNYIGSRLSNLQGNINYQDRDYVGERTDSVVVPPNPRQGTHNFTAFLFFDLIIIVDQQTDLSQYLWKKLPIVKSSYMFPCTLFGSKILDRKRVVSNIFQSLADQKITRNDMPQSIHISGCRGSGKTNLLMLMAEQLARSGYEVYFFSDASFCTIEICREFQEILTEQLDLDEPAEKKRKIAVLIDEITPSTSSAIFTTLLKSTHPNLVVLGACVPKFQKTGHTAKFRHQFRMLDIVLKEDDDDFRSLIEDCKQMNVTTPQSTEFLCNSILNECGGHVFPTVAFIERCFRDEEMKRVLQDNSELLATKDARILDKVVYNNSFSDEVVINRCFDLIDDHLTYQIVDRVLSGHDKSGDVETLESLGWWNFDSKGLISDFLYNHLLSTWRNHNSIFGGDRYMNSSNSCEQNAEDVIMAGFELMEERDFQAAKGMVPVENALSFNWAKRVLSVYRNAYLRSQESSKNKGCVDFYLNGFADDIAIEFIRNGCIGSEVAESTQSIDISAHLERFTKPENYGKTKYHWKRFALVNLNMKGNKLVLPLETVYHDRIYTYMHSSNTLYRGKIPIKAPAVGALPCSHPLEGACHTMPHQNPSEV